MKKITTGLMGVAAVALALGLGACNKNEDCCGKCKDKAVMKDGSVKEASAKSCSSTCSGEKKAECASKCSGEMKK
jgi:hypothetical protein